MRHIKHEEVKLLVEHNIPVLVTGEKGSGKTTLIQKVAKHLEIDFFGLSMTRQTTLSQIIGFKNVNGTYIPSLLRQAYEHGGLFLLDEIDAADPNVLLCLNTIENGFISFPDKIVYGNENFRLAATSNPADKHSEYTGRAKLDAATLDRFDVVKIDTDSSLEESLVGPKILSEITAVRKVLKDHGYDRHISMRDSIRYKKRKAIGIADNYIINLFGDNPLLLEAIQKELGNLPSYKSQADCTNIDELWKVISQVPSTAKD